MSRHFYFKCDFCGAEKLHEEREEVFDFTVELRKKDTRIKAVFARGDGAVDVCRLCVDRMLVAVGLELDLKLYGQPGESYLLLRRLGQGDS